MGGGNMGGGKASYQYMMFSGGFGMGGGRGGNMNMGGGAFKSSFDNAFGSNPQSLLCIVNF